MTEQQSGEHRGKLYPLLRLATYHGLTMGHRIGSDVNDPKGASKWVQTWRCMDCATYLGKVTMTWDYDKNDIAMEVEHAGPAD